MGVGSNVVIPMHVPEKSEMKRSGEGEGILSGAAGNLRTLSRGEKFGGGGGGGVGGVVVGGDLSKQGGRQAPTFSCHVSDMRG